MEAGVPGKTGNVPSLVSKSGEAEVLGTTSASNAGGPSSLLSASAISLRQLSENVNPADGRFLENDTKEGRGNGQPCSDRRGAEQRRGAFLGPVCCESVPQ